MGVNQRALRRERHWQHGIVHLQFRRRGLRQIDRVSRRRGMGLPVRVRLLASDLLPLLADRQGQQQRPEMVGRASH